MGRTLQTDTVIIGGGLTGLTIGQSLKEKGKDYLILEKEERVGGVINTLENNGFTYETGPNTGVLSHPEVAELYERLAGSCTLEIANPSAKKRLIWKNGSWHPLPGGLKSAVTTPLFSLHDKFRILGEPFRRKGTHPDETVAELVKRRLGKTYLDYAVDPFISGVYAGDPSRLITRYALPKLYHLEQNHGSFIRGAIKKKSQKKDPREQKATREVFSTQGGMVRLIQALDAINQPHIVLNSANTRVNRKKDRYAITYRDDQNHETVIHTRQVISTVGGYALPGLFPFLEEEEKSILQNIPYASVVQAVLGFNHWEGIPLNAFGGLVPSSEHREVLGILFPSAFLTNRAPEQGALLSVFIGGIRHPEVYSWPNSHVEYIVEKEVKAMMHIKDFNPDVFDVFRYEHAIPQYDFTSGRKLQIIEQIEEKHPGLLLAGNIKDGIGMADRIKQGMEIAKRIPL